MTYFIHNFRILELCINFVKKIKVVYHINTIFVLPCSLISALYLRLKEKKTCHFLPIAGYYGDMRP